MLIPKQNEKDLEDIPADLLAQIGVHPVETLEEGLRFAFSKPRKTPTKAAPSGAPKSGAGKKPLRRRSSGKEKSLSLAPVE